MNTIEKIFSRYKDQYFLWIEQTDRRYSGFKVDIEEVTGMETIGDLVNPDHIVPNVDNFETLENAVKDEIERLAWISIHEILRPFDADGKRLNISEGFALHLPEPTAEENPNG